MTSTATRRHAQPAPNDTDPNGIGYRPGPLGRLTRVLPNITFSHG